MSIQDGKTKEFKNIAKKCIAAVLTKEKGKTCSRYDWYFNAEGSECHILVSCQACSGAPNLVLFRFYSS